MYRYRACFVSPYPLRCGIQPFGLWYNPPAFGDSPPDSFMSNVQGWVPMSWLGPLVRAFTSSLRLDTVAARQCRIQPRVFNLVFDYAISAAQAVKTCRHLRTARVRLSMMASACRVRRALPQRKASLCTKRFLCT